MASFMTAHDRHVQTAFRTSLLFAYNDNLDSTPTNLSLFHTHNFQKLFTYLAAVTRTPLPSAKAQIRSYFKILIAMVFLFSLAPQTGRGAGRWNVIFPHV